MKINLGGVGGAEEETNQGQWETKKKKSRKEKALLLY